MAREPKIAEISVVILFETEKAFLVATGNVDSNGKDVGVWLPKSQCEYDLSDKTMQMPEWLAEKNGLI